MASNFSYSKRQLIKRPSSEKLRAVQLESNEARKTNQSFTARNSHPTTHSLALAITFSTFRYSQPDSDSDPDTDTETHIYTRTLGESVSTNRMRMRVR